MPKNIEDILNETLAPEMKASIQEAFDAKVEAMRSEIEESVRSEIAARYEHDKNIVIEGADQMIADVLREYEETHLAEVQKLSKARARYNDAIKSNKNLVRGNLAEMAKASSKLIAESIQDEVKALRAEKQMIAEKAASLSEDVEATKAMLIKNHEKHLGKINVFVETQLTKELKEFEADKRALNETRVKLIKNNSIKLAEAQKKFIKEAANKAEAAINETLTHEMKQLHSDIEDNRKNAFGRRMFEAFAAEFMSSHLLEGTEVRKLQTIVEGHNEVVASKDEELANAKTKLDEALQIVEATKRKVAIMEERAQRKNIMNELLANLGREKRAVMESMLENTKTGALKATFDRLLPVVLSESAAKPSASPRKEVLKENKAPVITHGDHKVRDKVQGNFDTEIADIVHLAGIIRK